MRASVATLAQRAELSLILNYKTRIYSTAYVEISNSVPDDSSHGRERSSSRSSSFIVLRYSKNE